MKKVIAIVLAAVMLLALAGCGSSIDTGKLDEILSAVQDLQSSVEKLASSATAAVEEAAEAVEEAVEEAPAEEEEAPAEEEEAPELVGADLSEIPEGAETLKIGLMVHQTGWFAGVDTPNFNEFNAMVDYINANGGWEVGDTTYYIEPVCVDGQSDYPALRTAAMSLVDAGVKFVVETNDFWVNSCADVFEEEGILHASAYCVGNNTGYLIPENPLAFTGSNGTIGDLQAIFAILAEYYPDVKTIAYANDDNGQTDDTYAMMQELAAQNGYEMVGQVIYPGDVTDYTSYAQQLVDTGADAFMGNGTPDAYGSLLKAVRALGSDMVMACIQGKPVSMVMEYAGPDASTNGFTVGTSTRASDADRNTEVFNGLVETVRAKYGDDAAGTFASPPYLQTTSSYLTLLLNALETTFNAISPISCP